MLHTDVIGPRVAQCPPAWGRARQGRRCFIMQAINNNSSSLARHKMVRDQLQRRGIHDRQVLATMEHVPREMFVLPTFREDLVPCRFVPLIAS